MLNFPVSHRQSDVYLRPRVTLDTSDRPDVARQEFRDEADINILLSRYGINQPRPVQYGDFDYDVDLQTALHAIDQAEQGYDRLPDAIRAQYPDWQSVIMALATGTRTDEIRSALRTALQPQQEQDHETRSDAESSGQGTRSQPATREGRGAVPDGGDQGTA